MEMIPGFYLQNENNEIIYKIVGRDPFGMYIFYTVKSGQLKFMFLDNIMELWLIGWQYIHFNVDHYSLRKFDDIKTDIK